MTAAASGERLLNGGSKPVLMVVPIEATPERCGKSVVSMA
jgi:hypothetical protein